jgi:hypothetical protein
LNALQLAGLIEWLFHPAMLYRATRKWWGDGVKRDSPHEGLDLCSYRTGQGTIRYLNENTLVPPIFTGRIVRIIDDFLGKSVFVRHSFQSPSGRLYTVYGHIVPGPGMVEGADIDIDTAVGILATGSSVPSHLHISVARVSDAIPPQDLDWKTMLDPGKVTLIDPLTVMRCPYSVIQDM